MLDIEKYIDWYKGLTVAAELLEHNQHRANRYRVAAFGLWSRAILHPPAHRSETLAAEFIAAAGLLEKANKEAEKYCIEIQGRQLYYIPTGDEWAAFDTIRAAMLEGMKESILQKINQSPAPPLDILAAELERMKAAINEAPAAIAAGLPLHSCTGADYMALAMVVCDFDFYNWLAAEIESRRPAAAIAARLVWKGTNGNLSELIKALQLTVFAGQKEADILTAFESILIDKQGRNMNIAKRHTTNINELQDTRPAALFTRQLNTAIERYLTEKYG